MDLTLMLFIVGLFLTALAGYLIAKEYLYQEFERTYSFSFLMFIVVLVSSVAILMMLVIEIA